jgi:hypothetical protein
MKSQLYYSVRGVVRMIFWSAVIAAATWSSLAMGDVIANWYDNRPSCEVVLHRDFTWDSTAGQIVNIDACSAPTNVTLLEGGTWEWTE